MIDDLIGDSSKSWSDVRANNPKVLRGKQLKESIYYEAKPRRKEMLEQQHESLRYEPGQSKRFIQIMRGRLLQRGCTDKSYRQYKSNR